MTDRPQLSSGNFWAWVLGLNAGFWFLLFCLGIPGPCTDDMFFTGTAVNLLAEGIYRNPWIEPWNQILQSDRFFFQPPFHAYTLALWLKMAGLSTASLLAFQNFWAFVFSAAAAGLMRRFGAPLAACLAVAPLFAIINHLSGFRPDILGFAYLAMGLWLISTDRPFLVFAGACLAAASVLTLTIFVAYALPFTLALLWINYRNAESPSRTYLWVRGAALAAAAAAITVLFLFCIEFKLGLFIRDYLHHASLRRPPTGFAAGYFIRYLFEYWGPVQLVPSFALFGAALVWAGLTKKADGNGRVLLLASLAAAVLNILIYPSSAVSYVFFLGWIWLACAIPVLFRRGFNWQGAVATAVAGLIFVVSQTTNLIGFAGQKRSPEGEFESIREYVRTHPDRRYAVDTVAAYYVFRYKFPRHVAGWGELRPPTEKPIGSIKEKDADVTWVVSNLWLNRLIADGGFESPRLKIFGRSFGSLPEKPDAVSLIP